MVAMGGGSSFQLMRIFGIRIGASASWFFVLFVIIYLFTSRFQDVADGDATIAYVLAISAALLFFGSLILHELGHALVARREGIQVIGIDLWFFGGVAKMSRDSNTPGEEFRIAAAGPAVSLLLAVVFAGAALAMDAYGPGAGPLISGNDDSPVGSLFELVAYLNAGLLVFNLIPGFPLDGGRIARAVVWRFTKNRNTATRAAGYAGLGFAYLMIAGGVAMSFASSDIFGGLWLAVLGWFLATAARSAVVGTKFTEKLDGITVADIMDAEPVAIPAATSAMHAQEQWFLRYGWGWFPVVAADGRFLGLLRSERADGAVTAGQPMLPAGELLDEDASTWGIPTDTPLEALIGRPELRQLGALMAVDGDGRLRGVVTLEQVQRAVSAALPG